MKFIHYHLGSRNRLGILKDNNSILPLSKLDETTEIELPEDMNSLIESLDEDSLRELSEAADKMEGTLSLEGVQVLAPIEYPIRHLFCLGKNYLDHAAETKGLAGGSDDVPKFPIYFF